MNSRQFAVLISITFFVGMVWLISDIIFNTKASIPISPKLESSLEEVNPNFNARVLDIIDKETLGKNEITLTAPVPSPEIITTPIPEASSSSQVSSEGQTPTP